MIPVECTVVAHSIGWRDGLNSEPGGCCRGGGNLRKDSTARLDRDRVWAIQWAR